MRTGFSVSCKNGNATSSVVCELLVLTCMINVMSVHCVPRSAMCISDNVDLQVLKSIILPFCYTLVLDYSNVFFTLGPQEEQAI